MHVTPRSYLTAGIAALGVGAIALAPVQPIPTQVTAAPESVVSNMAVNLAAAVDPIAAWVNVFQTSGANIETLGKFNDQNPFPLLKTIGANWATYFEELQNGQGNLIPEQIWNNIVTFFEAPWDPGPLVTVPNAAFGNEVMIPGLDNYFSKTQPPTPAISPNPNADAASPWDVNLLALQLVAGLSQSATPDNDDGPLWELVVSTISPLWRFLATPYSGQVVSWLGPLLSPVVALTNSFTAVGEYFQEGKVMDALYELINIPANMTNGLLNGAGFLNLTPVLGQFFELPAGFEEVLIGFNVGGLLNSMPQDGSLKVNPEDPQPARPTTWASGTGFDSLAVPGCAPGSTADICGDFINNQPFTGLTNGVFGAGIGLGQFLADKLVVTPPEPTPPVAAEPESAKLAAPLDIPAPALTEPAAEETVPVAVDVPAPAEESAPAVVDEVTEESTPAIVEVTELEAPAEIAELEAPAEIAEDAAPKAAASVGSDDSGDTASRPGDSRRGANDAE